MTIKVSPERLQEEKLHCKHYAENMQQVHDQLNRQYNSYHSWQGESSTAFQQMWTRWGSVINDMHVAFENLQGFLAEAALVYEQTDTHISHSIEKQPN